MAYHPGIWMPFSWGICPCPWASASVLSASTFEASLASLGSGTAASIWAHAGLSVVLPMPWPLTLGCTPVPPPSIAPDLYFSAPHPPSTPLEELGIFMDLCHVLLKLMGNSEGRGESVFWHSLCLHSPHCHFHSIDAVLCWHRAMGHGLLLESQVGSKMRVCLFCNFQTQLDPFTRPSPT